MIMNKKISKIFLLLLITFVLISSLAMLLKEKNTKINNMLYIMAHQLSTVLSPPTMTITSLFSNTKMTILPMLLENMNAVAQSEALS